MTVFAHSNASRGALVRRAFGLSVCLLVLVPFLGAGPTRGQPAGAEPAVRVPGFWDPRRRPEKPDLSRISVIRFLTDFNVCAIASWADTPRGAASGYFFR